MLQTHVEDDILGLKEKRNIFHYSSHPLNLSTCHVYVRLAAHPDHGLRNTEMPF